MAADVSHGDSRFVVRSSPVGCRVGFQENSSRAVRSRVAARLHNLGGADVHTHIAQMLLRAYRASRFTLIEQRFRRFLPFFGFFPHNQDGRVELFDNCSVLTRNEPAETLTKKVFRLGKQRVFLADDVQLSETQLCQYG